MTLIAVVFICILSALLGMVNHTAQWYRPRGRLSPEQIADAVRSVL